ncbi:MAG TPA: hypothetical protein VJZ00_24745 [Thermoanaerobaculia bacterium]|nr:hypothetical protein [Thermoanaerobaculia bacterium]
MNQIRFEAEIIPADAAPHEVVRERVYGNVQVTATWPDVLTTRELRVAIEVNGDVDRRDAPAYVELFFHDVFLLLNLASPGSFAGTISITGGEFRVRELTFDARCFASAPSLPLANVVARYDSLRLGTRQIAGTPETIALFELLHLARTAEDEETSIVRLSRAAEALLGRPESLRRLFELRDEIARGRTVVFHPMQDDALDPRVEDATRKWIEVADAAAAAVVGALRARVT